MAGVFDYLGLKDMLDGGGAGKTGDTFEGGALSELLNSLGIRPVGFGRRQADPDPGSMMGPPMAPTLSTSGPAAPAPSYGYVVSPPQMPVGGGMPAAPPRPSDIGGLSYPGATLTPEQIEQLLMSLGLAPQMPMTTPPMGSGGGTYDTQYRGQYMPPNGKGPF